MQTGHRILLVGDHKQLPPTFSEEVKDIIKSRFSVGDESPVFGSDFERIYESAVWQDCWRVAAQAVSDGA
jgi:superfamily I DNA and/or RNA helicase